MTIPFPVHFGNGNAPACRAALLPEFDRVAVVILEQPGRPVVVIDHDFVRRLDVTMRAIPPNAAGLVLMSSAERAWVAGADVAYLRGTGEGELRSYLQNASRAFGLLTRVSMPTAAALHAACLGGGLELACHCDGLIACPAEPRADGVVKPWPIGLPEAGLGICPGWGGSLLMPARMEAGPALVRAARGETVTFEEARDLGMFDAVAESKKALLARACEWVMGRRAPVRNAEPSRWIGGAASGLVREGLSRVRGQLMETAPGRAVVGAVEAGLERGWQAGLESERESLIRLVRTAEAMSAMDAFLKRSAPAGRSS